jgi:hypothetical protein
VDLSDHFQHQDASMTRINFLRYSETEWQRIAENEFAYCNRQRASEYLALFQQQGFTVDRHEIEVDQESMSHLQKKGFPLHQRFSSYTPEDICSTSLSILLRKHAINVCIPYERRMFKVLNGNIPGYIFI